MIIDSAHTPALQTMKSVRKTKHEIITTKYHSICFILFLFPSVKANKEEAVKTF